MFPINLEERAKKLHLLVSNRESEQNELSENERRRYIKTKDPKIIISLLKNNFSFLKEKWVAEELVRWDKSGEDALIKKTFSLQRGERSRKTKRKIIINDLKLVRAVDELTEEGMTKTQAFEKLMGKAYSSLDAEGNKVRYYKTIKRKPCFFVDTFEDCYVLTIGPVYQGSKKEGGKTIHLYGDWVMTIKK